MSLYALLDSETDSIVLQYPLTIFNIRALFPNVSLPEFPTPEQLISLHLVIVQEIPYPNNDPKFYNIVEINPINTNGFWTQTYSITEIRPIRKEKIKKLVKEHLANKRYEMEIGGVIWNDLLVDTDRSAQAKLSSVFVLIKNELWTSGKWKFKDGKFRLLNKNQMLDLCLTVMNHVKICYEKEDQIIQWIDEHDDDFNKINNWTWSD